MSCIITTYCISNTGNPLLNDTYLSGGTHNGEPYYSGETNGYVIYYTTSNQWCLSDVLDGTCILSGKFPCTTICPDINDEYLSEGVCPTTTTTTTIDCSILDFEAIFDCEPTPTPSSTPIQTPTPTPTQTSIPPDPCSGTSVVATIELIPSSPTPTPSSTPPPTPTIDRPCVFSGDVTFNTIEGKIICPYSFEFQDCFNGATYLTTNSIFIPTGGTISQFMVFQANVNGDSKCISYVGINLTEIGGDSIEITEGPYGFSNLNGCTLCTPIPSPTPTPSVTPTLTPSVTPTPTSTPVSDSLFYVYRECVSDIQKPRWVVQTQVGATTTPGKVQIDDVGTCWEYQYSSNSYPSLPPSSIINYTGNYFSNSTVFDDCSSCSPLSTCIESLTFVVEYNNNPQNGSPCPGGHQCNRAVFNILANNQNIGQVNLNNAGGSYDNVNRPPNYPNYPGAHPLDRYDSITITSQQAQNIANNSPNGLINFSFNCGCVIGNNCSSNTCHTGVGWVRIVKDIGQSNEQVLFSGCPTGNMLNNFDPCQ